jgi:hypothetical protein
MIDSIESYEQSYHFRRGVEPIGLLSPSFLPEREELDALRREQERIAAGGHLTMTAIELFESNSRFHETDRREDSSGPRSGGLSAGCRPQTSIRPRRIAPRSEPLSVSCCPAGGEFEPLDGRPHHVLHSRLCCADYFLHRHAVGREDRPVQIRASDFGDQVNVCAKREGA